MQNRGIIASLLAAALWGVIPTLFKLGLETAPLSFFLVCRFSLTLLLMSPILVKGFQKIIQASSWETGFKMLLGLILSYYGFGKALEYMAASTYIVLYSLNPIVNFFILKFRISASLIQTVLLALAGTLLVIWDQRGVLSETRALPILLLGLGMIGWSYYAKHLKTSQANLSDIESSVVTHLLSLVACLLWWALDAFKSAPLTLPLFWISLTFAIASPLAFYFFSVGLRHSPALVFLCQSLEPIFGLLTAALVLGEKLSGLQYFGTGLVIFGVWLFERRNRGYLHAEAHCEVCS